MAYTDILIDFDDTIFDTHGNAIISLGEVFEHFNLGRYFDKVEDFTIPYWKTNVELWNLYSHGKIERPVLMVERFRRPLALGKGLSPSKEYCLEVSDYFLDRCGEKSGLIAGARQLLEYLQQKYRLHVASNGFHEVQYKKMRSAKVEQFFTSVILSEDAGANKPSTEYFDYALAKIGALRQQTIMIGDTFSTDIMGAMNYGIDQIFLNHNADFILPVKPTHEVKSLLEIMRIL
ncbi:MAG: YjjG family noncanonical pyrimidine nucleotidase [Salinivirgaceae bacterium]|nr:YjjG family noncanonical pyrimidine nucleotidase [Salinivirgaceae bacterium]